MKKILLSLIKFYQNTSFLHNEFFKTVFLTDQVCKYEPTCSRYTYGAIEKYGVFKGSMMGLKRIIRCNPWTTGGHDPVV